MVAPLLPIRLKESQLFIQVNGVETGAALGVGLGTSSDNPQLLHLTLQVLLITGFWQKDVSISSQVVYPVLKKKSAVESAQVPQASHILGQCDLTLSKLHRTRFLLTQAQFLFSWILSVIGSLVLNLVQLLSQVDGVETGAALGVALEVVVGEVCDDMQVLHLAMQVLAIP